MAKSKAQENARKRRWNRANPDKRRESSKRTRRGKKIKLLLFRGGKCANCRLRYDGTNAIVFQFHHRDPAKKSFNLNFSKMNIETLKKEAKKCDILCANCHRLHHSDEY